MMLAADLRLQGLSIEDWPIERLIPTARNARTHSAAQVRQIAASIKEFGFINPVLVNHEGGIIAGHGRVLAARKMGLAHVPVVILRHLTKEQERAFRVADNQIASNAGWDFEMLRLELEALAASEVDLDLLGFTDEQLKEVLTVEIPLRGSDPDSVPEQLEPVSRCGDLWELGRHRLLCGDGTQRESLATVLAGQPCNLVFTDPPYGVAYTGKGPTRMKIANDDVGPEFGAFLRSPTGPSTSACPQVDCMSCIGPSPMPEDIGRPTLFGQKAHLHSADPTIKGSTSPFSMDGPRERPATGAALAIRAISGS